MLKTKTMNITNLHRKTLKVKIRPWDLRNDMDYRSLQFIITIRKTEKKASTKTQSP